MGMRLHGNYLVNVFYLSSKYFDYSYNSRYHLIINNILVRINSKLIITAKYPFLKFI